MPATEAGRTMPVLLKLKEPVRFTGERLKQEEPRVYASIVRALSKGWSMRECASVFRCSPQTVTAIADAHGLTPGQVRERTATTYRMVALRAAERQLKEIDTMPINLVPSVGGIATDKAQQLEGEPAAIYEHRSTKVVDINALIAEVIARKPIGCGADAAGQESGSQHVLPAPAPVETSPAPARSSPVPPAK